MLQNLPVHKPVVINLGDDSSDEEETAHTVPPSVDKLLGGLDDFLKAARRSAEAAPGNVTDSQTEPVKPATPAPETGNQKVTGNQKETENQKEAGNQKVINQAASEKWKKWKKDRELKEKLKKFEDEILRQR